MLSCAMKNKPSPLTGTTGAAPGLHLRRTAFPDLVRLDTPGLGVPADSSEALIPLPSEPSDYPSGSVPGTVPSFARQHRVSRRSTRQSGAVQLSSVCRCLPYGRRVVAATLPRTPPGTLARWTPSLRDLLRRSDLAKMAEKAPQGPKWAGGPNLKTFGGPPMTARTPAGRLCSHRSLTVVYRGGPDPPKSAPGALRE